MAQCAVMPGCACWSHNTLHATQDLAEAPLLLHYTAAVVRTLPQVLNHCFPTAQISMQSYGTKLACAVGGGAKYPKHIDNLGLPDTRKVTCIYYINPDWNEANGGELRLWGHPNLTEDLPPTGDRLVMFWSDLLVHEVLPCWDEGPEGQRFALTLWMVTDDEKNIASQWHPLYPHREVHFAS